MSAMVPLGVDHELVLVINWSGNVIEASLFSISLPLYIIYGDGLMLLT